MEVKETIQWQVEGMDCSSCAISIKKFLEKKGMKINVVNDLGPFRTAVKPMYEKFKPSIGADLMKDVLAAVK